MIEIKDIRGREILDSRGNPTVEADVTLADGTTARAGVPSGASTGTREAVELRDGDKSRYLGKGTQKAVANVNGELRDALIGNAFDDQRAVDQCMLDLDGTDNKSRLGANALLAISLDGKSRCAVERRFAAYTSWRQHDDAGADDEHHQWRRACRQQRRHPGVHDPAGRRTGFCNEALRHGAEIFHALKAVLNSKGLNTAVGDEGGFAPDLPSNQAALDTIMDAIEKAGFKTGSDILLGLDVASSEFYKDGVYDLESEGRQFDAAGFSDYLAGLVDQYPIITIEDGMDEGDWEGWGLLTQAVGDRVQLVGDDLFVTNTSILERGINENIANAILIKPNQIGTLSETLDAITMAVDANYAAVISHRSGETSDATIADISVGTRATQIKTGSLSRSDRIAKYNQLLRIQEELGSAAGYAGREAFSVKAP